MSSKVSSAKGSKGQKKPGQKHKNTFAFVPNKFSSVALKIASLPIQGVCGRCKDILEWKQRMGKYKPLSQPKTCLECQKKTIKHAYHTHCYDCAKKKNICAKCHSSTEIVTPIVAPNQEKEDKEKELEIQMLSERQRRSYYRKMENGDEEGALKILQSAADLDDEEDFDDDEVFDGLSETEE